MKKLPMFPILFVLSLYAPVLWAAGEPNDVNLVSLEDYLQFAATNNAGLKSGFEQWNAAKEQIPQARSLPDPQVSYGYATKSTPQRSTFEVMQMFPWFGTISARKDATTARSLSAGQQYNEQQLELFYNVKQAYYEYCYLKQAVGISKENVEFARHFEEIIRSRYSISNANHPDVIRAQIELAKSENDLASFEKLRPAIAARLNSLLNRPVDSALAWPEVAEHKKLSMDSNSIFSSLVRNNPQLKALEHNIEAARADEKTAQKKFYPDLGVGVAVDAGMGKNGESRTMPKVAISLPIWRKNYKAAERQAKAQISSQTQQKIQMTNDLLAKTRQIIYEYENNDRTIRLYGDTIIPKTRQMLAASEAAYLSNTIDFLNLIDAQRALLENRLVYEKTICDNAAKLAEIEMLIAIELPMNETEN
jgi:cobalt-zinc-cadmium efflux system outer membrane protein